MRTMGKALLSTSFPFHDHVRLREDRGVPRGSEDQLARQMMTAAEQSTHLSVLCEVDEQHFTVLIESQGLQSVEDVVARDGLAFLVGSFFSGLRGDEGDELGSAFLDAF